MSVPPVEVWPVHLTAQHGDLVAQREDLDLLGAVTAPEHDEELEDAAEDEVQQGPDHEQRGCPLREDAQAMKSEVNSIESGELLRDHVARRTALGLAVQKYLDHGELVPDQVVLDMVREALVAAKAAGGGFVLDGIPRNMQQARAAYLIARELGMTADVALHLQAADEELMRRLLARAALEHRSDDTADIIAQRL